MNDSKNYSPLMKKIIDGLVYHPSRTSVRQVRHGDDVDLFVTVHSDDMGLVIGKDGKTAKSLQSLFRNIGLAQNEAVGVSIKDEGTKQFNGKINKFQNRSWNKTPDIIEIMERGLSGLGFESRIESEEFHDKTLLTVTSTVPLVQFEDLGWILKMICSHSGRKLAIDWRQ